jgi:hypothetical protein
MLLLVNAIIMRQKMGERSGEIGDELIREC